MSEIFTKSNNTFFRQLLFIMVLIFVGVIIWQQLGSLLSSFLGAITIYALLRNPLFYLTEKKRWKAWLVSLVLIAAVCIAMLGIGFLVVELIIAEIPTIDTSIIINALGEIINKINNFVGYAIISKSLLIESKSILANIVSILLNSTYNVVINLFMMMIVLYFMLANARKLEKTLDKYSPFKGESQQMIKNEIKGMIYSNAVGIPVIMLAQAIASCIGYSIVGTGNIFFWGFLTALFGLIPVVGSAAIWIPMASYLFFTGSIWQGIVLVLYGVIIISNADNACRMVLMKKMSNTHPLIVIFGVILGIPLFGFWGIIFGPLLISSFLLLIKIYFIEYGKAEKVQK